MDNNMSDLNQTCEQVQARLEQEKTLLLLDVREAPERAFCAIAGSEHIPMGEIPQHLDRLDRDTEMVVYCHHGMRSMQVVQYLKMNGFDRVHNLAGGIDAWSQSVDPELPRYR